MSNQKDEQQPQCTFWHQKCTYPGYSREKRSNNVIFDPPIQQSKVVPFKFFPKKNDPSPLPSHQYQYDPHTIRDARVRKYAGSSSQHSRYSGRSRRRNTRIKRLQHTFRPAYDDNENRNSQAESSDTLRHKHAIQSKMSPESSRIRTPATIPSDKNKNAIAVLESINGFNSQVANDSPIKENKLVHKDKIFELSKSMYPVVEAEHEQKKIMPKEELKNIKNQEKLKEHHLKRERVKDCVNIGKSTGKKPIALHKKPRKCDVDLSSNKTDIQKCLSLRKSISMTGSKEDTVTPPKIIHDTISVMRNNEVDNNQSNSKFLNGVNAMNIMPRILEGIGTSENNCSSRTLDVVDTTSTVLKDLVKDTCFKRTSENKSFSIDNPIDILASTETNSDATERREDNIKQEIQNAGDLQNCYNNMNISTDSHSDNMKHEYVISTDVIIIRVSDDKINTPIRGKVDVPDLQNNITNPNKISMQNSGDIKGNAHIVPSTSNCKQSMKSKSKKDKMFALFGSSESDEDEPIEKRQKIIQSDRVRNIKDKLKYVRRNCDEKKIVNINADVAENITQEDHGDTSDVSSVPADIIPEINQDRLCLPIVGTINTGGSEYCTPLLNLRFDSPVTAKLMICPNECFEQVTVLEPPETKDSGDISICISSELGISDDIIEIVPEIAVIDLTVDMPDSNTCHNEEKNEVDLKCDNSTINTSVTSQDNSYKQVFDLPELKKTEELKPACSLPDNISDIIKNVMTREFSAEAVSNSTSCQSVNNSSITAVSYTVNPNLQINTTTYSVSSQPLTRLFRTLNGTSNTSMMPASFPVGSQPKTGLYSALDRTSAIQEASTRSVDITPSSSLPQLHGQSSIFSNPTSVSSQPLNGLLRALDGTPNSLIMPPSYPVGSQSQTGLYTTLGRTSTRHAGVELAIKSNVTSSSSLPELHGQTSIFSNPTRASSQPLDELFRVLDRSSNSSIMPASYPVGCQPQTGLYSGIGRTQDASTRNVGAEFAVKSNVISSSSLPQLHGQPSRFSKPTNVSSQPLNGLFPVGSQPQTGLYSALDRTSATQEASARNVGMVIAVTSNITSSISLPQHQGQPIFSNPSIVRSSVVSNPPRTAQNELREGLSTSNPLSALLSMSNGFSREVTMSDVSTKHPYGIIPRHTLTVPQNQNQQMQALYSLVERYINRRSRLYQAQKSYIRMLQSPDSFNDYNNINIESANFHSYMYGRCEDLQKSFRSDVQSTNFQISLNLVEADKFVTELTKYFGGPHLNYKNILSICFFLLDLMADKTYFANHITFSKLLKYVEMVQQRLSTRTQRNKNNDMDTMTINQRELLLRQIEAYNAICQNQKKIVAGQQYMQRNATLTLPRRDNFRIRLPFTRPQDFSMIDSGASKRINNVPPTYSVSAMRPTFPTPVNNLRFSSPAITRMISPTIVTSTLSMTTRPSVSQIDTNYSPQSATRQVNIINPILRPHISSSVCTPLRLASNSSVSVLEEANEAKIATISITTAEGKQTTLFSTSVLDANLVCRTPPIDSPMYSRTSRTANSPVGLMDLGKDNHSCTGVVQSESLVSSTLPTNSAQVEDSKNVLNSAAQQPATVITPSVTANLGLNDEIETIDLTWIEDVDQEQIKEVLAIFVKKEEPEYDEEFPKQVLLPSPSPGDSGIGSPVRDFSDLIYANRLCFCDKTAVYLCECKMVMYCSHECQTLHWPLHRNQCRATKHKKKQSSTDKITETD